MASFPKWLLVTSCLVALGLLALLLRALMHEEAPHSQDQVRPRGSQVSSGFAVLIDAGSTGTRVHVYRYRPPTSQYAYPSVELPSAEKKTTPGLSIYAPTGIGAGESLQPLLQFAQAQVPRGLHSSTPLHVMATAGLRMLPPAHQQAILRSVRAACAASGFLFKEPWARVLSGTQEGLYAWLGFNYAAGTLQALTAGNNSSQDTSSRSEAANSTSTGRPSNAVLESSSNSGVAMQRSSSSNSGGRMSDSPSSSSIVQSPVSDLSAAARAQSSTNLASVVDTQTRAYPPPYGATWGVLELGGASLQLTFLPRSPWKTEHATQYTLPGAAQPLQLYTHSFLGWGLSVAFDNVTRLAAKDGVNPCLQRGYKHTPLVRSTGNFTACVQLVSKLVVQGPCRHATCSIAGQYLPPLSSVLLCTESFYYTAMRIGLPHGMNSSSPRHPHSMSRMLSRAVGAVAASKSHAVGRMLGGGSTSTGGMYVPPDRFGGVNSAYTEEGHFGAVGLKAQATLPHTRHSLGFVKDGDQPAQPGSRSRARSKYGRPASPPRSKQRANQPGGRRSGPGKKTDPTKMAAREAGMGREGGQWGGHLVTLGELEAAGHVFCQRNCADIQKELVASEHVSKAHAVRTCFAAAYAWVLLHQAFHVDKGQPGQMVFTNTIQAIPDGRPRQVNWVLGALLTDVLGPQGSNPSLPGSTTLAEAAAQTQAFKHSRHMVAGLIVLALVTAAALVWVSCKAGVLPPVSSWCWSWIQKLAKGKAEAVPLGLSTITISPHVVDSDDPLDTPKLKPRTLVIKSMIRSASHGGLQGLQQWFKGVRGMKQYEAVSDTVLEPDLPILTPATLPSALSQPQEGILDPVLSRAVVLGSSPVTPRRGEIGLTHVQSSENLRRGEQSPLQSRWSGSQTAQRVPRTGPGYDS